MYYPEHRIFFPWPIEMLTNLPQDQYNPPPASAFEVLPAGSIQNLANESH
jgi:hypothetical protein